MITRKNYEIYFIDYLENNLSENEISMLVLFLENNPDLKDELNHFSEESLLEPSHNSGLDFSFLKKESSINESNEDDFFIGKIEGELNEEEIHFLNLYLSENPEKRKVLESFEKTKLPIEFMMFPNRNRLKKSRKIGFYYYLTSGVAACILALLYFNINFENKIDNQLVVENNEIQIEINKEDNKIEIRNSERINVVEETTIPKRKKTKIFAKQVEEVTPIIQEKINYSIDNSNKIEKENVIIKKHFKEDINKDILASNSVNEIQVSENKKEKTVSVKEYIKEKTISVFEQKTVGKKDDTESLLAFAEKKVKEIPLPKFIDYDSQKSEKQEVKTLKIGNIFSIKRKIRI